jgi:hypothetical protein
MERPIKLVVNCDTGEENYIPLTDSEMEDMELARVESEAREAVRLAEVSAQDAIRESARAKLAALGLTEAEIAALVK